VRADLPDDIDEPVIAKVEANSDPIIWIAFSSNRHTTAQLTDYVDRFVIDQIKRIDGVADAIIFAERRYAMRIWLDAMAMAAHSITTQDVEDALERRSSGRTRRFPAAGCRAASANSRSATRATCARSPSSTT
jgi:multidrug efflux pump